MRYLGLDLGTRSLGIALSDTTLMIATPYKTIKFDEENYESLLPILEDLIKEFNVVKLVLGLPKNMNNSLGDRANTTIKFKELIENNLNTQVVLQDERLSTVEATNYMLETDISRKKRKKKVDALAANIILQTYLDKERVKK